MPPPVRGGPEVQKETCPRSFSKEMTRPGLVPSCVSPLPSKVTRAWSQSGNNSLGAAEPLAWSFAKVSGLHAWGSADYSVKVSPFLPRLGKSEHCCYQGGTSQSSVNRGDTDAQSGRPLGQDHCEEGSPSSS